MSESTTKRFKIELTPIDKFFFGGDNTFQVGNSKKEEHNSRYMSYIIKSAFMPQQTSLLGMIRFLTLQLSPPDVFDGTKITNVEHAKELIGEQSFTITYNGNDFGSIKSLSACKIEKEEQSKESKKEILSYQSLIHQYDVKWNNDNQSGCRKGFYNGLSVVLPFLTYTDENGEQKPFSQKEGVSTKFSNGEGYSDIFKEDRRIIIKREHKTGQTEDDSLAKQIGYRFANQSYKFVFNLEVSQKNPIFSEEECSHIVYLGADNSMFRLKATALSENNSTEQTNNHNGKCIVIQSPTFIEQDKITTGTDGLIFAVTKTIPFRFIQSTTDEEENGHKYVDYKKRSRRYLLYAPGSTFFFDNVNKRAEFEKIIKSYKCFTQIGYNEYNIIKL